MEGISPEGLSQAEGVQSIHDSLVALGKTPPEQLAALPASKELERWFNGIKA